MGNEEKCIQALDKEKQTEEFTWNKYASVGA